MIIPGFFHERTRVGLWIAPVQGKAAKHILLIDIIDSSVPKAWAVRIADEIFGAVSEYDLGDVFSGICRRCCGFFPFSCLRCGFRLFFYGGDSSGSVTAPPRSFPPRSRRP